MGDVADLRPTWHAPDEAIDDEPIDTRPPAFESFFEEQKERLLRTLSVITGSSAEGEDLTQEAFTRVFERWDTVAAMEDPAGYLHRTAMNLFRNQYRRTRVALTRAVGAGPEQDVFKPVEDRDVAARALGALTPRQRAALVLTEALGYSARRRDNSSASRRRPSGRSPTRPGRHCLPGDGAVVVVLSNRVVNISAMARALVVAVRSG